MTDDIRPSILDEESPPGIEGPYRQWSAGWAGRLAYDLGILVDERADPQVVPRVLDRIKADLDRYRAEYATWDAWLAERVAARAERGKNVDPQ